jgi:hypothetical protein
MRKKRKSPLRQGSQAPWPPTGCSLLCSYSNTSSGDSEDVPGSQRAKEVVIPRFALKPSPAQVGIPRNEESKGQYSWSARSLCQP